MATFGTNVGEKFAKNALTAFFERSIAYDITNQDYEGEIKGGGADRLNILSFGSLSLKNYTGAAMSVDTPSESEGTLLVNQKKAYYFQIEDFAKFSSYVSNPESTLIQNAGKVLAETVDSFVLGFYGDVGSGNRVGTDYTTGTVEVTVTTGAVTGSGTTFTAAMVGLGFKATGHTSWYRIKTYSSATSIVIEDDKDDETSAYTGGAIGAGASYTIEAATVLSVTTSTVYGKIVDLKTKLDQAKIPMSDRALVVPSVIGNLLLQSSALTPAVATAYENVVLKGMIGTVAGFKVYQSEQVAGNNTTGYFVLAMHKSWLTMAMAMTESGVEDFIGGFGQNFKGLWCYGAKVVDSRRRSAAYGFWKV
jgi:hypothetical protein